MAELQAIALALKCVPFSHLMDLFTDSQAVLDVYKSELEGHSGVLDNECADVLAKTAALSNWHLPHLVCEYYLRANGIAVSGNFKHFV
ncbi:hypothetical protein G9A89_014406 [Geosiphon pyriformis]|nr:hypothetical protein G9A89_014406 [Geosiphon pyriformis]